MVYSVYGLGGREEEKVVVVALLPFAFLVLGFFMVMTDALKSGIDCHQRFRWELERLK